MENLAECPNHDPAYQTFSLGGPLPAGLAFPFDFGFIPSTLAKDGDPLDISFNKSRGIKFKVKGRHGPKRAAALVDAALAAFKRSNGS